MDQPSYFVNIREGACRRWEQLEADLELAGPWRQLFRQVQSPRHVLSELLQNADDAGATEATAEIVNGEFVFSHNGEDFNEEQFASLCRFGFSNKRNLHTIGFRGVGFKSTFSLGDEVRLITPTLSVAFHKRRFTQPEWVPLPLTDGGRTEVRVAIKSEIVEKDLRKNLNEWSTSAASLLFFNSLRRLRIGGQEVQWVSHGHGPVEDSEWMSVSSSPDNRFLLVRSSEEEFPDDALQEIRDERMADGDETTFPPCRVEIVLGMEGRLFVVLGTGVTTQLPFACNAPFIQDPARVEIKDPAISPTNRWLLSRSGELAADAMLTWINHSSLSMEERCKAYDLFPGIDNEDTSLKGRCGAMVKDTFDERIQGRAFLLTEDGDLESSDRCLAVPRPLLNIWSPSQISAEFGEGRLAVLSRHVGQQARENFIADEHVEDLLFTQVFHTLKSNSLPRPESWRQLSSLWTYVSDNEVWYLYSSTISDLRIVPVQGRDELYAADDVVRIDRARTLHPSDLDFLAPFLSVLDRDWPNFLSEQSEFAETTNNSELKQKLGLAERVMVQLELSRPTSTDRILQSVTDSFFAPRRQYTIRDCARLAHIAARLRATVPTNFQFVTQDKLLRPANRRNLLADISGSLDMFVSAEWYSFNVLHDAYAEFTETCTGDEWTQWVLSPSSGLHTFVPLDFSSPLVIGREKLETLLRRRGYQSELTYHYKSNEFRIEDWDFPERHWKHWSELAREEDNFWGRLLTQICKQSISFWSGKTSATVRHFAGNGHSRLITQDVICPGWLRRLRNLPCLPDTYGQPRQPAELLRRTRETESLLGVEPFVNSDLDNESTRPLLRLLGVGDKPTGPERLLERLQALATSSPPLVSEVQKWCHSLDQIFDRCSTDEVQAIKATFAKNRLILTEEDEWARTDEVFLSSNNYDLPGTVSVHPSLHKLALWRKIGVSDRPTVEMELEWLKGLETGQKLDPSQARRIRSLLSSYPRRVWDECGHWISLDRTWVMTDSLEYSLTMQSLVAWNHLFPQSKGRTADFQMLASETCQSDPYSNLLTLGEALEERPEEQLLELPESQTKPWISALGNGFKRIVMEDSDQRDRFQTLAHRLSQTSLQVVDGLRSTPYIKGVAVGTPRAVDALWRDEVLYVKDGHLARLASKVPQEIGRTFAMDLISEATKMCYERDPGFIEEYLEDNFTLIPIEDVETPTPRTPDEMDHITDIEYQADLDEQDDEGRSEVEGEATEELTVRPGDDNGPSRRPTRPRPNPQPPVIERFSKSFGFTAKRNGSLYNAKGSWIAKTDDEVFPWACYSPAGDVQQYFWTKDHCLQREPLEIRADVWRLCEQSPHLYSLILTNLEGTPEVISGSDLIRMRRQEQITLHPATYRLIYEN